MKTNSPLTLQISPTTRLHHRRNGEIMNTLVFMLVAVLLPAWLLGTLYLSFFPASASPSGASDVQLATNADGTTDPSALSGTSDNLSGSPDSADRNALNSSSQGGNLSGGDFNPSQANIASGLAADQKAAFDKKIKSLQSQLNAKSQELEQLRKSSKSASMNSSSESADTSQLKNQIADLTKDRNQLKARLTSAEQSARKMTQLNQQIRTLKEQSSSQETEIETLQDQLAKTEAAKRKAENQLFAVKTNADSDTDPADSSPTLAGSPSSTPALEFREWVSSRGSRARLAFVRWEDDRVVVVNAEGKEFRLSMNRLSLVDQKYVNGKR